MITIKDVLLVINTILNANFPNIEIQATDIEEGFNRPSFFVEVENNNTSNLMTNYKDKNLSIRIYYFPSNRETYQIEIIEVEEKLEELFCQKIKINEDFYIAIDETESETIDRVLQFVFDLNYVQELEDTDESELIDTLDINIKV